MMEFIALTTEQIRSIGGLSRKVKVIAERRARLLVELERATRLYQPLVEGGIEVRKSNNDEAGLEIVTPFGNARTSFGWTIDGAELMGTVLFEREQRDAYGKTYWEAIFGLRVPEYNAPSSSAHADALIIPLDERFGDDFDGALRRTTIAIVFGIINGPVVAPN